MADNAELMAAGMSAEQARLLGNTKPQTGLVATGSTIADALALTTSEFAEFATVGSGNGALLANAGGSSDLVIFNGGASPLTVYPQAGQYINGTLNGTFSVTNGKAATFIPSGTRWIAVLSA